MSHVTRRSIHAYADRGLDLTIAVTTSADHTDFSALALHVGSSVSKTGLTADDTATGFNVDVTLTAADLDLTPGLYTWELRGTFGAEVRVLGTGPFVLAPNPT